MANVQKCIPGSALANANLLTIVIKCLAYPKIGTLLKEGGHCTMFKTWDGNGNTPAGWTKAPTVVWSATALDSQLPIDDPTAALLAIPANQARLTAPEVSTLNAGLVARVPVDLEAGNYILP